MITNIQTWPRPFNFSIVYFNNVLNVMSKSPEKAFSTDLRTQAGDTRLETIDEKGSLKALTERAVLETLRLPTKGKIYNLSRTLERGIPTGAHGDLFYSTVWTYNTVQNCMPSKNNCGFLTLRLELPDHSGTHIDALNHISIGGRLYGNVNGNSVLSPYGTNKLGIETVPPIICSAVLLDIAGLKKKETLDAGYVITPTDISESMEKQSVKVRPGDAVLLNTGWGKLWMVDNSRFIQNEPGIGFETGKWLVENSIVLVGADNHALEVKPFEDPDAFWPVHQYLITEHGMFVIENLNLDDLAHDKVYRFALICLPLPVKGASGSPITPIAVV
jgi:kynurenine formamidase